MIAEVGAGLQVTPNGARVLRALGVWAATEGRGLQSFGVEPCDALTGRRLARLRLSQTEGGWLFLHRADLQAVLREAALAAGATLRTSSAVVAVAQEGVRLGSGEIVASSLIVGADGIHSVVRRHVVGDADAVFTGQVAWRAVVKAFQEPVARIWMAPGRHVVTYPLPAGRLNLVAVREDDRWTEEGWSHRDHPDSLRRAFADVAAELGELLERVGEVGRWGLFHHPVPERWHRGRAVLLGDAAHPTLPFLAQGANLALEDSWVLAREWTTSGPVEGLRRYEELRRQRVIDAIAAANANARNFHLGGLRRLVAHHALRSVGVVAPRLILLRLDWLYGFDVTAER